MAAELRVWLMGAWRRNKAKAVVKLLALAPGHRLHREQLMDLLWAVVTPAAEARALLEAALSTDELLGARPRQEAVRTRLQAL